MFIPGLVIFLQNEQILKITAIVNFGNLTYIHFVATVSAYTTRKCAHNVVLKEPNCAGNVFFARIWAYMTRGCAQNVVLKRH